MHGNIDYQLYNLLERIRSELIPFSGDDMARQWITRIDEQMERIVNKRFRVAVVGEFNRGKTSLINTLLQRELLPTDVLATTATTVRVVYGGQPRARLKMMDDTTREVPIEALADSITKLTRESEAVAAQVKEAIIEFPAMFLSDHVELIDTPGLNDNEAMNQLTLSRLQQIDLAIMAISPGSPFSMTEAAFMAELVEKSTADPILFAITKIDEVRPKDIDRLLDSIATRIRNQVYSILLSRHEPEDAVMRRFHQLLDHPILFPLSATMAQDALKLQNEALYIQSGYRAFNDALPGILLEGRRRGLMMYPLEIASTVIDEFLEYAGHPARLKASLEQLQGFRLNFAKAAYAQVDRGESLGAEHRMWLDVLENACDLTGPKAAFIEEQLRQAWEGAPPAPDDRMCVILDQLGSLYRRLDRRLTDFLGTSLHVKLINDTRSLMRTQLIIDLPYEPQLASTLVGLCEAAIEGETLPELKDHRLTPFTWRTTPIPLGVQADSEAFLDQVIDAAWDSFDQCIQENWECMDRALNGAARRRRDAHEQLVRDVFQMVRQRELAVEEELVGASKLQITPERLDTLHRLRERCDVLAERTETRDKNDDASVI